MTVTILVAYSAGTPPAIDDKKGGTARLTALRDPDPPDVGPKHPMFALIMIIQRPGLQTFFLL